MTQIFLRWTRKMNKTCLHFFVSLLIFLLRQAEGPSGMQEAGSEWKKKGEWGSYLQHYALGKIYPW